eukprot:TRINITY_DN21151_c1_g1_i1.p1 TRINITY_DN21151_c1_g1~~TRINITY_DN21151_c1_g1_i1.p1  ORF type:complete len:668 (-),score=110.10 TRINITY_DN21151_c1_g1_i1:55-2058(-)
MKKAKLETYIGLGRFRFIHVLLGLSSFYLLFLTLEVFRFSSSGLLADELITEGFKLIDGGNGGRAGRHSYFGSFTLRVDDYTSNKKNAPRRPQKESFRSTQEVSNIPIQNRPHRADYGRISAVILEQISKRKEKSELQRVAKDAWLNGSKAWREMQIAASQVNLSIVHRVGNLLEPCPDYVLLSGDELEKAGGTMILPCGLNLGSSITLIGKPLHGGDSAAPVLQFMVELQGLKVVDGEEPPRILHFNPRLKGDWSGRSVIELNTCYRMQWGKGQRCDGLKSPDDEDKVDGFLKCEKWIRDDNEGPKESKTTWWLNRFIGREMKPEMDWPFPFAENRTFVLTIRAGLEGYHMKVDGRHVTSFPYRTGFALEDATGLSINGNIESASVYATSLPTTYQSVSTQRILDMSNKWKAPPLRERSIELFIGILSTSNHFAERMAVRKTWLQSASIRSARVVARFFVALNIRTEVNIQLKNEADFFGDVIIVPFIDRYELVVLKTVAICDYGVNKMSARYIMKCDDDNFVRVDEVLKAVKRIPHQNGLYMGNLNRFHKPLRFGKWAVSYEEWPEEQYPTYANGPGYIISNNVANFVVSQHANNSLRLFKMEDVSMGMWVEQFNASVPVQYYHSWRFCQYGCVDGYYTAHYQSPRQMLCLWDNLLKRKGECCSV